MATGLFWSMLALAAVNLLWFVLKAANPLVVSDTWHFIGTVIQPYATGTLEVGDLFVKRSALDHSQPLRKLISLMNYEWFDLDFRVEGLIGVAFALVNLGILGAMWQRSRPRGGGCFRECLVFVSLAAVYLSVGETVVLTWPLVTLNYTSHLFVLGYFWMVWRALVQPVSRRLLALFAAGFITSAVADDTALIATIAAVLATVLHGWREGRLRASLSVVASAGLGYVAYAAAYRLISSTPEHGAASLSLSESLASLLGRAAEAWQWIVPPLVSSVIHRRQLADWTVEGAAPVFVVAVVLAAAHAWFWVAAFRIRGRDNALVFTATSVMLLFYGLVAGIVLARVTQFGADYLWQPRYALIYRWNLVALLLMTLGHLVGHPAVGKLRKSAMLAPLGLAVVLLGLQLPLSLAAWRTVPYVNQYQHRQALQIGALARNPEAVPNPCMPGLVVCRFPEQKRRDLVGFLVEQRLNIFSPAVQERTGFTPWPPGESPPGDGVKQ